MFGTEFALGPSLEDNVMFFYLVLPFAFTGSPGIFGGIMQGAQWFHRLHAPSLPSWNGADTFSAEVFADDGMFLEAWVGNRADTSVSVWGEGADLFFGNGPISKKKLRAEGMWSQNLLLSGYQIDLQLNVISLPPPKILGACNLINSPSLDPGCYVLDLHVVQELRGCINHWSCTGRVWRWLVEPVNSLLALADINQMWVRCADQSKWGAFWSVMQFIRDVTQDDTLWPLLFSGTFSDLVGVQQEIVLPEPIRSVVWFSADATPTTVGGVNWPNREYFVIDPLPFIRPFLPISRNDSHIDELEYLVEIMRTVTWSYDDSNLILFGVTDNATANSWIANGKSRRGDGLQLTRTFHMWLLKQQFRFFSFYSRSGHNMSADFLPRASENEVAEWATRNRMARINHGASWGKFCTYTIALEGLGHHCRPSASPFLTTTDC